MEDYIKDEERSNPSGSADIEPKENVQRLVINLPIRIVCILELFF